MSPSIAAFPSNLPDVRAMPASSQSGAPAAVTARAAVITATPSAPTLIALTPGQAGSLAGAGAVTGPYTAAYGAPSLPPTAVSGDGLLQVAMSAPNTSWGPGAPSSVVVDAQLFDVTANTTVSTQQFVLFAGAQPFTYAGFTGPVTTADRYQLRLVVEPPSSQAGLSQTPDGFTPTVDIADERLQVVDPSNPLYLAYEYAPVMFGRTTSALHDVPLLADATATPVAGGTQLSYTVIWSHEDSGTGFLPLLEWGAWGRITDIENAISFTVPTNGAPGTIPTDATYLWGGEPATGFPDSEGALQETDEPFQGAWDGTHPVLRDATGNNDFSDQGTTAFRFQLAPVDGPPPGASRESVMDANPFTYQVMSNEIARWYEDGSTDPHSPQPGVADQYAIIDLNSAGTGVSAVRVDLQLSGGPTWYSNDAGTGDPLIGTGHRRTVVKLPLDWQNQSVTGARLEVTPPSAASSLAVHSFTVEALTSAATVLPVSTPALTVVGATSDIPTAIVLAMHTPSTQTVRPGAAVASVAALVTDALGSPLSGVPVTFSSPATPGGARAYFTSCGCTTITTTSGADGIATSGPATTSPAAGTIQLVATTVDSATTPAISTVVSTGTPLPRGYRLVGADGGVFAYGDAGFYGSAGSLGLDKPIVGMAATPDGGGYWLVGADGGVFAYGDAGFYGSAGSLGLDKPIVGMAATPDGGGYWLVGADGGVFAYGDAGFYGSAGSLRISRPIVGMTATPDGGGYWLVSADGGVFAYGDADFYGSATSLRLNQPIVGIGATPDGGGYRLVGADGGVSAYGDAGFYGSAGSLRLNQPIVGMAATPHGGGYRLVGADGGVFAYGDAGFSGSAGSLRLNRPIVGMAS